jgi:hypothetical protein
LQYFSILSYGDEPPRQVIAIVMHMPIRPHCGDEITDFVVGESRAHDVIGLFIDRNLPPSIVLSVWKHGTG